MEQQENQSVLGDPISQNTTDVGFPQKAAEKKSSGFGLLIPVILLLVVVFGGIGFFIFKSSNASPTVEDITPTQSISNDLQTTTNTPTPTKEVTTTPTKVATIKPSDRQAVKIQVWNGTGTPGEATYLQSQLKSLGYSQIEVGNSSSQNATTTIVTFSQSLSEAIVNELTTKLKSIYEEVSVKQVKTPSVDVDIVTGTRAKSQSSTTTPTVTKKPTTTGTLTPTQTTTVTPTQ